MHHIHESNKSSTHLRKGRFSPRAPSHSVPSPIASAPTKVAQAICNPSQRSSFATPRLTTSSHRPCMESNRSTNVPESTVDARWHASAWTVEPGTLLYSVGSTDDGGKGRSEPRRCGREGHVRNRCRRLNVDPLGRHTWTTGRFRTAPDG